jgi:hypothetical protein
MAHTTYSLTQLYAVVEGKIPENDAISRQILVALLALKAFNPDNALTLRSIAKAIGAHPQQVKRKITGDRHCYSRLKGLVRWQNGRGRKGTRGLAFSGRQGSRYRFACQCDISTATPKQPL